MLLGRRLAIMSITNFATGVCIGFYLFGCSQATTTDDSAETALGSGTTVSDAEAGETGPKTALPDTYSRIQSALSVAACPQEESNWPPVVETASTETALRLLALSADILGDNARNGFEDTDPEDGGWDFTLPNSATRHSPQASPENTYGATGLGLWAAPAQLRSKPRVQAGMLDVYLGATRRQEVDSPPDIVFLTLLAETQENTGYAELARQRYEAAKARAGGTLGLTSELVARRMRARNDGLVPYDLAWMGLAAAALSRAFPTAGYAADVEVAVQSCKARVGLVLSETEPVVFDLADRSESYYVHGLSGTLLALSLLPDSPADLRRVRQRLYAEQLRGGAFGFNASYPTANLQATAHAVTALSLAQPTDAARERAQRAAHWLAYNHTPGGGFEASPGVEGTLLDAEILLAFRLAYAEGDTAVEDLTYTVEDVVAPSQDEDAASTSSALSALTAQPSLASPASLAFDSSVTRR